MNKKELVSILALQARRTREIVNKGKEAELEREIRGSNGVGKEGRDEKGEKARRNVECNCVCVYVCVCLFVLKCDSNVFIV